MKKMQYPLVPRQYARAVFNELVTHVDDDGDDTQPAYEYGKRTMPCEPDEAPENAA